MGEITRKHHYTIDLDKPLIWRYSGLLLATGDDNGDEFFFKLRRNGANITQSGEALFTAHFIRSDDVTVPLEGVNDNGVVHVTLDKKCYKCAGRFVLAVKSTEGEDTTTLAIIDGYIKRTATDSVVDPDEKIVSLPELVEMVDEMEQATAAATKAVKDIEDSVRDVDAAVNNANEAIAELEEAKESGEFKGEKGDKGDKGDPGTVTADSIKSALGYTPMNPNEYAVSVKALGANGDGETDDTTVFQTALAGNRKVYVPGGTYKLSGELIIGMNCQLELAQDAFLDFTQTDGNCISMRAGANIIGNHATINVPYAFTGKVINIYAGIDSGIFGVPPLKTGKWGPMWAAGRYITDLHIVKLNSGGVARSVDGTCSGTAVYLRASYQDSMNFLWAVDLNKLRIAGGFTYGIHLDSEINPEDAMDGWIHQTKIDGFITGCEVAVYLKDSTLSYISVRIVPDWGSSNNATYCKHGIVLENSTNVDLSQSRVMDWDTNHTLWEEGGQYQHLALLGNCAGLILSEHYYYSTPNHDIRSLIYTDTPSNLEKLTILQEPFTRWFKPKNGVPYFNDGYIEKKLLLQEEFEECFQVDNVPDFENALPSAINKDGTSFNDGLGYYPYGKKWLASNGVLSEDEPYYGCTGLIPIKAGDTVYTSQITWRGDGYEGAVLFDSAFNRIQSCTGLTVVDMTFYFGYETTDAGFALTVKANSETANAAYIAFSFERSHIGDNPMVSVNNPVTFSQKGFMADSIFFKDSNLIGDSLERANRKVAVISSESTDVQYPSAKAVYTALHNALGAYVDDIASLIGGDA